MAKLNMSSAEPLKMIRLIEQMFPGVNLDSMEKMLEGIQMSGTMTVSKKLSANETFTLEVTVTNP